MSFYKQKIISNLPSFIFSFEPMFVFLRSNLGVEEFSLIIMKEERKKKVSINLVVFLFFFLLVSLATQLFRQSLPSVSFYILTWWRHSLLHVWLLRNICNCAVCPILSMEAGRPIQAFQVSRRTDMKKSIFKIHTILSTNAKEWEAMKEKKDTGTSGKKTKNSDLTS